MEHTYSATSTMTQPLSSARDSIIDHESTIVSVSIPSSGAAADDEYYDQLCDIGVINQDGQVVADVAAAEANQEKIHSTVMKIADQDMKYREKGVDFWNVRRLVPVAEWWHLACWCNCMILSASLFSWPEGLAAGWATWLICLLLAATAFQILVFCLAEMTSALPFSGGSYGYVRSTLHLHAGFVCGWCETLELILTTAVNVLQSTTLLSIMFETDPRYNPLWDLLCYTVAIAVHLYGGRRYWQCIIGLTVLTCGTLIVYFFVTVRFLPQLAENAISPAPGLSGWFIGGGNDFMSVFYLAVWYFVGIECGPLASEETVNPKQSVPKGIVVGMSTVILQTILVFIAATATPQIAILTSQYPLETGFGLLFGLQDMDSHWLKYLMIGPMYAAAFGFVFAYGRQVFAMSRSGLLPTFLSLCTKGGVPWAATLFGSAVGYTVCLLLRVALPYDTFSNVVYSMMLTVALVNYCFQLIAYTILKISYHNLKREYNSPVGVPGAAVAFCIYILGLASLLGWSEDIGYSIAGIMIWLAVGFSYYWMVASKSIILSPEEQATMLLLYSLKFQKIKERRMRNARKYQQQQPRASMDASPMAPSRSIVKSQQQSAKLTSRRSSANGIQSTAWLELPSNKQPRNSFSRGSTPVTPSVHLETNAKVHPLELPVAG